MEQLGAGRCDQGRHARSLVGWQVVQDHDVAGPQFGDEHAGHVGFEGEAVERAVEHKGRHDASQAQARGQRGGLPVTVRHAHAQPLSAWGTAARARHLGRGAGLVDEDQPGGVEVELAVEPRLARLLDVGPVLLGRVGRLFLNVMARRWKKRHRPP